MSKYVDPQYIINNLCDIFNENLGVTLKDIYEVVDTALSIEVKDLNDCNCGNCIFCYTITQETHFVVTRSDICDCSKSTKYGKPIKLSDVCPEWEGE